MGSSTSTIATTLFSLGFRRFAIELSSGFNPLVTSRWLPNGYREPQPLALCRLANLCHYAKSMVSWDETKRRANLIKHGMDLAEVAQFDFENANVEEDRDVRGEQRFRATGFVGNRLCFCVYTDRGDDIHAISLRPATRKELRNYEEKVREL